MEPALSAVHTAGQLRTLAAGRGIRDLASVETVHCRRCGAAGDAVSAFSAGLGHWPDCASPDDDKSISFIRRTTT